jgi:hypothetical protein
MRSGISYAGFLTVGFVMNLPKFRPVRFFVAISLVASVAAWWAGYSPSEPVANAAAPAVGVAAPAKAAGAMDPSAAADSVAVAKTDQPAVPLFSTTGPTAGQKLVPNGAEAIRAMREGRKAEGRVTALDRKSFSALTKVTEGDRVRLPLADGDAVEGIVQLVKQESGNLRVAGKLDGNMGTFALNTAGSRVGGVIQFPRQQLAYSVDETDSGGPLLREVRRADVICAPLPRFHEEPAAQAAPLSPAPAPPILSSRPTATAVIYLDFDGETVTDPAWDGGATIVAPATVLTNAQITDIFNRVKEDFWPFNIDVTTDLARYTGAPVGRRMRCIMTPNDAAAPGAGGVAYINSFSNAGGGFFTPTIPCWVFNGGVVGIAEAISHEIGHTLGLVHDGRELPTGHEEYYQGQGTGSTSWAPIMGVGYYVQLVQWSRGQYQYANNQEDDVALIARSANGFGYIADEAGNDRPNASTLNFDATGAVLQTGIITTAADEDFYRFGTTGGAVSITATPAQIEPNLDIELEIQNSSGVVVGTPSNPIGALNATVSAVLPAGSYFLVLRGVGEGSPLVTGYSDYGSIGAYTMTGNIPGGVSGPPIVTSPGAATGEVGLLFNYQIRGTDSPSSYAVTGTLPPGLEVSTTSGLISGTPTTTGTYNVTMSATNVAGTGTKALTIQINPPSPPNLQPYAPPGWSDNIVVSVVPGTNLDAQAVDVDDTVYIDFAVINRGTLPASGQFINRLFVDNVAVQSFTVSPPLASGQVAAVYDVNLGQLTLGQHTIRVTADVDGAIAEGDETDNSYTRTINIIPPQVSNLKPTTPPSWSDSIVISSVKNTNTDGPAFTTSAALYIDYAVVNSGPSDVSSPFATQIYLDGELFKTVIKTPPVGINIVAFESDIPLGHLTAGQHTLRIKIDSTGSVPEPDETDNEYTRTFNIVAATDPNLTFQRPPGWSSELVLSRIGLTHVDTPIFTSADPLFMDLTVLNNGKAQVTSTWTLKVSVDGVEVLSRSISNPLLPGQSLEITDYALPPLSPGEHLIKAVLDANDNVTEGDDTADDNEFSRSITVVAPTTAVDSAAFAGLIRPTPGAVMSVEGFGMANFKVTSGGSFTGNLVVGSRRYGIKGALDAIGDSGFGKRATAPATALKRPGASPLVLDFRLGGPDGGEQLIGDVSSNGLAMGGFSAARLIYTDSKNPAPPLVNPPAEIVSHYTAIFPAKSEEVQGIPAGQFPQGSGVGFADLGKSGSIKFVGTLADGEKFSFSAPMVTDNRFPFHASMAKGRSVLNGMVDLRTQADISDFDGSNLTWVKVADNKASSYKAGWPQGIFLDVVGAKHVRAKKEPALPWLAAPTGAGNAAFFLSGAGLLESGLNATIDIGAKDKVTQIGTGIPGLKLNFNAVSGATSGEFTHPTTGKKTKFSGAVLDTQQIAGGYFLSGDQSGKMTLSAPE